MKALERIPAGPDEGPGVLQSAWRYKWLVATMVLLGMLAGYGWSVRQPTRYEGVSRVLLTRREFGTLQDRVGQPANDPDRFVRNQAEIITSAPVLRRATELVKSEEAPLTLRGRVDVEVTRGSDVLTIRAWDSTPEGAAALANAVGVAYKQVVAEQFQDAARQAIQELRAVKSELEGRFSRLEPALQASPNDPGLKSERDAILQGLAGVDRQIQLLRVDASLAGTGDVDLEKAAIPDGPTQPRPRRTAAAGALFGLIASGALAWWLNGRRAVAAAESQDDGIGGRVGRRLLRQIGATARKRGRVRTGPEAVSQSTVASGDLRPDDHTADTAHLGEERRHQEGEFWLDRHRPKEPHGNGAAPRPLQEPRDVSKPPLDERPAHGRPRMSQVLGRVLGTSPSEPDEPPATPDLSPTDTEAAEFQAVPLPLDQLTNVLADQPLTLYTDEMPQVMAEETAERVAADVVALLLDNGRGVLDVAGGVGLDEDEWKATVTHDDEAVRSILREGVGLYRRVPMESGPQHTNLPGSSAETFVVAPLLHEGLGFGVLLAGRKRVNGRPAQPFSKRETDEIVAFALDATPLLRTAVLLRYLKARLQA